MLINGKKVDIPPGETLLSYLEQQGYNPSHVVVEKGREIITRERFGEITLAPDDEINILRFMGGG